MMIEAELAVPVAGDNGEHIADSIDRPIAAEPLRVAINVDAVAAGGGSTSESIAALRNYIAGQHLHSGNRAIAICAPHLGTGCTYLATNLAMALAQSGVTTLLIDGNLRSPGIDQVFTPSQSVGGLSDFLAADGSDAPVLIPDARPNLSILFAGTARENCSELLAKKKLKLLINESVRSFDCVIIDCPPAANFGDARRIASLVRHALVVARRDHSYANDVKVLIRELRSDGVNVVGTFLNILD